MFIQKYMDEYYWGIREGCSFHYFGSGCIVDYCGSTVGYLLKEDMDIVECCDGSRTIDEICAALSLNKDDFLLSIRKMNRLGFLEFRKEKTSQSLIKTGERSKFYPKEVAVEVTSGCNYNCSFCYRNATKTGRMMADDVIKQILSVVSGGIKYVLITGGEPTIHPNIDTIITQFTEVANTSIITNGSNFWKISSSSVSRLDHIQFSVYGWSDSSYDRFTGNKNGLTDLKKSVCHALDQGVDINGALTLSTETMGHEEELIERVIFLGIPTLKIGIADAFGREEKVYNSIDRHQEKIEETYTKLLKLKKQYRADLQIQISNINTSHIRKTEKGMEKIFRGGLTCGCGSDFLTISPSGNIRPCQLLPENAFSYGDMKSLTEHIHGNFHIPELNMQIKEYISQKHIVQSGFIPCEGLENQCSRMRN